MIKIEHLRVMNMEAAAVLIRGRIISWMNGKNSVLIC